MNDRAHYWLSLAEYDLETARAMLDTGRYLYVGFMCHQVIEKALKAAISSSGAEPPRSHNLGRLAELAGLFGQMSDEQRGLMNALSPLNVQVRYPQEVDRLSGELDARRSAELLAQTRELYEWVTSKRE